MLDAGCRLRVMGEAQGGGGRGDCGDLKVNRMAATRASVVVWTTLVMGCRETSVKESVPHVQPLGYVKLAARHRPVWTGLGTMCEN